MSIILANKFKNGEFNGTFLLTADSIDINIDLEMLKEMFIKHDFYIDEDLSAKTNGFFAINSRLREKVSVVVKGDFNEEFDINKVLNINSN